MAELRDIVESVTGNSLGDLLIAFAVGIALLALLATIIVAARRHEKNAAEKARTHLLLDLARSTRVALLLFPVAWLAARSLRISPSAGATFKVLVDLSLVFQTALWVGTGIDYIVTLQKRRIAQDGSAITTLRAFRGASIVLVWTIAVLMALAAMGVAITPLIAGLGIGGVAVALAVQNILGDLFASLSIVVDKPFVVGDIIGIGTETATVERIGLKTTRLRSILGEQIVISNGELLKTWIHNYERMRERGVIFRIRLGFKTPARVLERIPSIIRHAVAASPNTTFDRAHFASISDSAYEFECRYLVRSNDYIAYMDAQQIVNLAIARALENEGIVLARPTRILERPAGAPRPEFAERA